MITEKTTYTTPDGDEFDSLVEAKEHLKKTQESLSDLRSKWFSGYNGRKALERYVIWHIRGEDPNCDFSGHHHNPSLLYFQGIFYDAVDKAVSLKLFFTWGSGGTIDKIEVVTE